MPELSKLPPTTSSDASKPTSSHNIGCLTCFYLLAAMWGARSIYHDRPSTLDWLIPLSLAVCLATWSMIDAHKRRYRIPMLAKPWFFLLYPFVVPGYIIWSRGWGGLGWVVLHFVLSYVVTLTAWFVGGLVIFGQPWLEALGL